MKSKKSNKVTTKESILKAGDRFRHKTNREILIYVKNLDKSFQKGHLQMFKKEATGETVEYESTEVEKIN